MFWPYKYQHLHQIANFWSNIRTPNSCYIIIYDKQRKHNIHTLRLQLQQIFVKLHNVSPRIKPDEDLTFFVLHLNPVLDVNTFLIHDKKKSIK